MDSFTRRQIMALTEAAVVRSETAGVFPTPLERVGEVAGIVDLVDIGSIPEELVTVKPRLLGRILGAYLYRTDTAFVDLGQPRGRRRFIQAHETAHKLLPWHEDSYHPDDELHLFRDTEEALEREANLAAAMLIFQGKRFFERALDYENSIKTPILLAETFGASFHATIRYYVEHHPDPLALAVAGRYRRFDGTVPVLVSVESPAFHRRFGSLARLLPPRGISVLAETGDPLAEVARSALRELDPVVNALILPDQAGDAVPCTVESFFNQRSLFLMVGVRHVLRRGRRLRLEAG